MFNNMLKSVTAGAICVAILVAMLVGHAWPLWTGKPIYLRTRPVDPRDVFRGDYVVLGYDAQQLIVSADGKADTKQPFFTNGVKVTALGDWWASSNHTLRDDQVMYVQLEAHPSGVAGVETEHVPVSISDKPRPGAINLRGLVRSNWSQPQDTAIHVTMHYGIDAFFVQEGSGVAIQGAMRDPNKPVFAEVMVTRAGAARLARLIVDGKPTP
jgi:uncharacterized membrane-anchored protein